MLTADTHIAGGLQLIRASKPRIPDQSLTKRQVQPFQAVPSLPKRCSQCGLAKLRMSARDPSIAPNDGPEIRDYHAFTSGTGQVETHVLTRRYHQRSFLVGTD